jgi:hypothetical protein
MTAPGAVILLPLRALPRLDTSQSLWTSITFQLLTDDHSSTLARTMSSGLSPRGPGAEALLAARRPFELSAAQEVRARAVDDPTSLLARAVS